MKRLAPNLFVRRFGDFIETGRSRLPSRAPAWTDYNAHDPGITLMELLAYVAEAQLYSLARMRRDERAAYAALLGVTRSGPQPASGTLWPDRNDPESPFLSHQQSLVIEPDAVVRTTNTDTPPFQPAQRILWTPGRITALRSLLADGRSPDHTAGNALGDRAIEPFGALAGPGDVLRLEFETNGASGLFPKHRELARGAGWPIGVRVAPALRAVPDDGPAMRPASLSVEMRLGVERIVLPVIADGTRGFMQNGVLLLDVSAVPGSPSQFAIEIRATRGFARAPRILAIEPGVLPIVQGGVESGFPYTSNGTPGQRIRLETPGLRFGAGAPPVKLRIREDNEDRQWRRVDDLAKSGPHDLVFELDTAAESVVLGNGVNGHLPEAGTPVAIDYAHCAGLRGNTARRQRWNVRGVSGVFGINPDPVSGGRDADTDADLRRRARASLRAAHALITAQDLKAAVLELPDLEVARAEVVPGKPHPDTARELTLYALRARASADEPADIPETARWLAAVRRALLARLPLGTRLNVRAPGYRTFSVRATIEAQPRRDPKEVDAAVRTRLRDELALTPRDALVLRDFGAPVTARDLAAAIRRVPGVRRVKAIELIEDEAAVDTLELRRHELPRLDLAASRLDIERAGGAA